MIEQTCKTNGKYLLDLYPDVDTAYKSIMNQYKEYRPSIKSCLKDPKNFVNDVMRFSQNPDLVKDKVSYLWFQNFLKYVIKCATKGMNIANSFMTKVTDKILSESQDPKLFDIDKIKKGGIKAVSSAGTIGFWAYNKLFLSIPAAIVLIGIGLWLSATGKIVKRLSSKPNIIDKLKKKFNDYFGSEEEDLPEELEPPNIDVPNISLQLSESIASHMVDRVKITTSEVVIKLLFLLFLKSVLSIYMYDSIATTITILVALFAPGLNLITYLLLWISIGVCAVIRYFKKPNVTLSYEDNENERKE